MTPQGQEHDAALRSSANLPIALGLLARLTKPGAFDQQRVETLRPLEASPASASSVSTPRVSATCSLRIRLCQDRDVDLVVQGHSLMNSVSE
jgi:hypothetical protein